MLNMYDPSLKSGMSNLRRVVELHEVRSERSFDKPATTNQVFFLLEHVCFGRRRPDASQDAGIDLHTL